MTILFLSSAILRTSLLFIFPSVIIYSSHFSFCIKCAMFLLSPFFVLSKNFFSVSNLLKTASVLSPVVHDNFLFLQKNHTRTHPSVNHNTIQYATFTHTPAKWSGILILQDMCFNLNTCLTISMDLLLSSSPSRHSSQSILIRRTPAVVDFGYN